MSIFTLWRGNNNERSPSPRSSIVARFSRSCGRRTTYFPRFADGLVPSRNCTSAPCASSSSIPTISGYKCGTTNSDRLRDTPVAPKSTKELSAWLRFHCSVPLVATPENAAFAVIDRPLEMPPLSSFCQGLPEYPDRSAMVILQVNGFAHDGLRLSGPGIENEHRLGIDGLPSGFWRAWRDSQAMAPLGVDLLFVTSDHVLGMPRSTHVEITT